LPATRRDLEFPAPVTAIPSTMPTTPHHLVLGAAVGYGVRGVWVFVESLRKHYDGEVMLLVSGKNPPPIFDYFKQRSITPVFFDSAAWMVPDLQFSRFIRYGEILKASPIHYDRILLTDVGDVLFQGHPFQGAPDGELLCFMETQTRKVADCLSNRFWLRSLFGEEVERQLSGHGISCSGTTIGTHAGILDYIARMTSVVRKAQFLDIMDEKGHDQGVHNYLLHTGGLPSARIIENGRHVYTVGYVWDAEVGKEAGRITVAATGQTPAIVHQYNYNPRVLATVTDIYPYPDDGGGSPE
jgi:hypothetical protein